MSSKPKSTKYVGEPYETLLVLQKNNFDSKVSKITNIVEKGMENPAKIPDFAKSFLKQNINVGNQFIVKTNAVKCGDAVWLEKSEKAKQMIRRRFSYHSSWPTKNHSKIMMARGAERRSW